MILKFKIIQKIEIFTKNLKKMMSIYQLPTQQNPKKLKKRIIINNTLVIL